MNRTLLSILAICCVAFTSMAEGSVRWLETTHNFGAFDESVGPVSCRFSFVNTGNEPVAVIAARPNCGCTAPKYSTTPIAPGDTGFVAVSYDPAGRPGRFDKFVAVDLSYPSSRIKLHVTGTVIGAPSSVSQRFPAACGSGLLLAKGALMTGEVDKGQLRTVFLGGYNSSPDTLQPSVEGLPPYLQAAVEPQRVPPGEQVSFVFYFNSAECPLYGLVTDSITIRPGAGAEACDIPSVAIVRENFSRLTPGQLAKAPVVYIAEPVADFGRISRSDATLSRTITIGNQGKNALEIRRVYTTDPGVGVTVNTTRVKKGKQAEATITVDPGALPGAMLNARISVITNDPANPVQTIRVVGEFVNN